MPAFNSFGESCLIARRSAGWFAAGSQLVRKWFGSCNFSDKLVRPLDPTAKDQLKLEGEEWQSTATLHGVFMRAVLLVHYNLSQVNWSLPKGPPTPP